MSHIRSKIVPYLLNSTTAWAKQDMTFENTFWTDYCVSQ